MISYIAAFILSWSCPESGCPQHFGPNPQARAEQYAQDIVDGARVHHVDPLLLAALAAGESDFDPAAVSWRGYSYGAGMFQLSPRWHDEAFALCFRTNECVYWHAREAAGELASGKRRCGSWIGSVRAYRLGRCSRRYTKQTWKVINLWRRLQRGWF